MIYQILKLLMKHFFVSFLKSLLNIPLQIGYYYSINYSYVNQTLKLIAVSDFHKLLLTIFFKGCIIYMNFEFINNLFFNYDLLSKIIEDPEKEYQELYNETNEKNSLAKDSFFFSKIFAKLLISFFIFILFDIGFEDINK